MQMVDDTILYHVEKKKFLCKRSRQHVHQKGM